jgi:HD-GYP domain-containing protein (c-di-GMP phosphodiesterase class II)
VKLIETHATRGKEILESLNSMPNDVIQIVYEHHENSLGQGYPRHLVASRIHPLSHIVIVANIFCNYVMPASGTNPMSPREALVQTVNFREHELDKKTMTALKTIIKDNESKKVPS